MPWPRFFLAAIDLAELVLPLHRMSITETSTIILLFIVVTFILVYTREIGSGITCCFMTAVLGPSCVLTPVGCEALVAQARSNNFILSTPVSSYLRQFALTIFLIYPNLLLLIQPDPAQSAQRYPLLALLAPLSSLSHCKPHQLLSFVALVAIFGVPSILCNAEFEVFAWFAGSQHAPQGARV